MPSDSHNSLPQVAIVVGSARTNGNTMQIAHLLCQTLQNQVSIYDLKALSINGFDYNNAFKADDFLPTLQRVLDADVIIFATPVYWYMISSQLKQFIDRFSDIPKFYPDLQQRLNQKRVFLLITGESNEVPEGFTSVIEKICSHLHMHYIDSLYIQFEGKKPTSSNLVEQVLKFAFNIRKREQT